MIFRSGWLVVVLALVAAGCLNQGNESANDGVETCPCDLPWDVKWPGAASDPSAVVVEPSATSWEILYNPSINYDRPEAVVVDDSAVYVAGIDQVHTQADQQWRFVKIDKTTAEPIWVAVGNPSGDIGPIAGSCDRLFDMTLHDGFLYVAGADSTDPVRCSLRVEKRSAADGSLVWSTSDQTEGVTSIAHGIVADDASVYVAGRDSDVASDSRWRVERRDALTGKIIWQVIQDHESSDDDVRELALFDGHLYLAGHTSTGLERSWRLEKRRAIDGELIWAVDNGPLIYPYTLLSDVAVDASGVYLVGVDGTGTAPGINYRILIQRRSLQDGSLVWENLSDQSEELDWGRALAIDGDHLYIAGTVERTTPAGQYCPDKSWRIEKYQKASGQFAWSRSLNPTPYRDEPSAVAVDATNVYVVGLDALPLENADGHDHQWRIEAFLK